MRNIYDMPSSIIYNAEGKTCPQKTAQLEELQLF